VRKSVQTKNLEPDSPITKMVNTSNQTKSEPVDDAKDLDEAPNLGHRLSFGRQARDNTRRPSDFKFRNFQSFGKHDRGYDEKVSKEEEKRLEKIRSNKSDATKTEEFMNVDEMNDVMNQLGFAGLLRDNTRKPTEIERMQLLQLKKAYLKKNNTMMTFVKKGVME